MKLTDLMLTDEQRRKMCACIVKPCAGCRHLEHELAAIAHVVVVTYPDIILFYESSLNHYYDMDGTPWHQGALRLLNGMKALLTEAREVVEKG